MVDTDFNPEEFEEQNSDCYGRIECPRCRKFHGYCHAITEQLKGDQMLPQGDSPSNNKQTSNRRKGGMEYITNEVLSTQPREAKVIAVKYDPDNRYGARVVLKLAIDGQTKFWGVPVNKAKSPNFRILTEAFGFEENDWVGKVITLQLEQDDFSNQYFVRAGIPVQKGRR